MTHIHVCWEQISTSNELLPRNLSLVKQSDPEEEEEEEGACCSVEFPQTLLSDLHKMVYLILVSI